MKMGGREAQAHREVGAKTQRVLPMSGVCLKSVWDSSFQNPMYNHSHLKREFLSCQSEQSPPDVNTLESVSHCSRS